MANLLDISNVIRVTTLAAARGIAGINTSALALITSEDPISPDFGDYAVYRNPSGVAADFGSNSVAHRLANVVFSQAPNVITGRGSFIVVPRLTTAPASPARINSSSNVDFTALTATDYTINLNVDGGGAADILVGDIDPTSLATLNTSLNPTDVTNAGVQFIVTGTVASASVELRTIGTGASSSIAIGSAGSGTELATALNISGSATGSDAGEESIKDCILRTATQAGYFGIILDELPDDADLLEIASTVQTMDRMVFVASNDPADFAATAIFDQIRAATQTHTRCLFYSESASRAFDFAAGYASRALSTNFDAPGTATTMHLKSIVGLTADDLTETQLTAMQAAGVDFYGNFGVPVVYTSGANGFFDHIYHTLALRVRVQVAYFNFLRQTNTKRPQTEAGMTQAKSTLTNVLRIMVAAGVYGPGTWTSTETIGDPEDHIRNIEEQGFYIYSLPVGQQSQSDRAARVAPAIQIAAKEQGAIHSGDVLIGIEV
jgi:hypothetical protein